MFTFVPIQVNFNIKSHLISKMCVAGQKCEQMRGELRIQGFSVAQRNVKSVEFQEAG